MGAIVMTDDVSQAFFAVAAARTIAVEIQDAALKQQERDDGRVARLLNNLHGIRDVGANFQREVLELMVGFSFWFGK